MRTILLAAAAALMLAGCDVKPSYDNAGVPEWDSQLPPGSAAELRRQAAEACTGSGFPAAGTVAAPGVPCSAVVGMSGGPPDPDDVQRPYTPPR